jgi:hypothetical protein
MAGGKETPRQKMIGMMYLVLTALLALNVSKEIIQAFVTIDKKLTDGRELAEANAGNAHQGFVEKEIALKAQKAPLDDLKYWKDKNSTLQVEAMKLVSELLGHSNEMIKKAEGGKDWIDKKDASGKYIVSLKSLNDLSRMDDYDIPTDYFIGPDMSKPMADKAGMKIVKSLHAYRDKITELMGNYKDLDGNWKFKAPSDPKKLKESLKTCNPKDTNAIAGVYNLLTQPDTYTTKYGGETTEKPYVSVLFYHVPIVAACAVITSMTVDVRLAETKASEFFLSKIDAPKFNFNKIEPMAFARTGYLNQNDTMSLRVMIAAYDSTEKPRIVYNGTEYNGPIPIKASGSPGIQKMSGVIYVKERGQDVPKNWDFSYSIGKPTGAVSLPELFVLYRGYPNKVVGAASGYPDYKLVGTNNVTLTKQGAEYIASPGAGRDATISIQGVSPDGKSANLGSFQFKVRNMPKPSVYLGSCEDGSSHPKATVAAQTRLFAKYGDEIPLTATFNITSWEINVTGAPRPESGSGPSLSPAALGLIKQARPGNTVSIMTTVVGPDGKSRKAGASIKVQ